MNKNEEHWNKHKKPLKETTIVFNVFNNSNQNCLGLSLHFYDSDKFKQKFNGKKIILNTLTIFLHYYNLIRPSLDKQRRKYFAKRIIAS